MKKTLIYCLHCLSCLFGLAILTGCTTREAPIVEGWKQNSAEKSDYYVRADDTVYSIAWAFGMDYRELIRLNHLKEPYHLQKGQALRMSSHTRSPSPTNKPTIRPAVAASSAAETYPAETLSKTWDKSMTTGTWLWPTQGKIIRGFSMHAGGNRGVDITGQLAQPVVATATGKVVYTGASLPGYGNLIIIKHSESELSAYAFNKVIAVKEGQVVKAGQTIAKMGMNDTGKAILHFEIRKNGKPVDPTKYLKK